MLREEEEEGARLIESGSCCVGNKEVSWEQQSVLFLLATVKGSNGGIGELAKLEQGCSRGWRSTKDAMEQGWRE